MRTILRRVTGQGWMRVGAVLLVLLVGADPLLAKRKGSKKRSRDRTTVQEKSRTDVRSPVYHGAQGTLRDGDGRIVSSTWVTPAGYEVTRDGDGQILSTASRSGSSTTVRDGDGRITHTTEHMPAGNTVTRDGDGRITVTSSRFGDTETFRDGDGRIIGTAYHSPSGTITYRDGDGRITGQK